MTRSLVLTAVLMFTSATLTLLEVGGSPVNERILRVTAKSLLNIGCRSCEPTSYEGEIEGEPTSEGEGELLGEGEEMEGERREGEFVEGESLEGEAVEGEVTEGEAVEGEAWEGELIEGEGEEEGEYSSQAYNFENMGVNVSIGGIDNWVDKPGQGSGILAQDETTENGSRVVTSLRTVAFDESAYLSRENDTAFSFTPFKGTEAYACINFDAVGEWIALFALGHDLDGDGQLEADPFGDGSGSEIGPLFGFHGTYPSVGVKTRNFRIQAAGMGESTDTGLDNGVRTGNAGHEWYRLQLRIDFTANGGDGSASLVYQNLSDGDTHFHVLPELQDINLGLSRMHPEALPHTWDMMWLHLRGNGSSVPSVDNLVPHVMPETL